MIHPVHAHQTATEHHARLLAEAERARLCQTQSVFVFVRPASERSGLRVALLHLLFWPSRVAVVSP